MSEITELRNLFNALAAHYSLKYSKSISYEQIFLAIFLRFCDEFDIEHAVHVWSLDIDFDIAVRHLDDFDFSCTERIIALKEPIIPFELRFQKKAAFKAIGENWIIHRYDADPFPSNPHAHNEDSNLKLDLTNGNMFRNRKYKYTIRKKELLIIREKAAEVYKGSLPDLAI